MSSIGPTVYRGSVAPTTGRIGDMWVDDTSFPILNFCTSISPLTWTPTGGMRPIKTTKYMTVVSGTHTFLSAGQWCRITMQAGGGSGSKGTPGYGGSGGEYVQFYTYVPQTSLTYSVGAGGAARTGYTNGLDGGNTTLGPWIAHAGRGGASGGVLGGGFWRYSVGYDDNAGGWQYTEYALAGPKAGSVCGGFGSHISSSAGGSAGCGDYLVSGNAGANMGGAGASGCGGGGNSFMGQGSAANASGAVAATTGYGAGGGSTYTGASSGAGGNGFLIIEEFGSW